MSSWFWNGRVTSIVDHIVHGVQDTLTESMTVEPPNPSLYPCYFPLGGLLQLVLAWKHPDGMDRNVSSYRLRQITLSGGSCLKASGEGP